MSLDPLPTGWTFVPLGELRAPGDHKFVGGPFGSDLTTADYVSGPGVPVIRGTNLGGKESRFVDEGFVFVTEQKAEELVRNSAYPGDVIFTQRGTLGQIGIIPKDSRFERYVISQSQMRLTPDASRVDSRYLYYYFRAPMTLDCLLSRALSTGVPHINLGILRDFPVMLPPIAQQQRIAAILDKADALRAKRRAALAQLDALTQSIFLEMFGDAQGNSKDWPVCRVSEYVAEFQGGKSLESEGDQVAPVRNRVLKISAVTGMRFAPRESKPVPDTYTPPIEHFVRHGDLLFSRANTTELVGAVAYVRETPGNLLLPDKLWRFVWRDPASVEPIFVWALFQTPAIRREIERRATGTSGSMKNISQEKLFGISTILPPVSIQREFAARLASVDRVRVDQAMSSNRLDTLFASLQHRAFRGEL